MSKHKSDTPKDTGINQPSSPSVVPELQPIELVDFIYSETRFKVRDGDQQILDLRAFLQQIRARLPVTYAVIGSHLGISSRTVENWFQGHSPRRIHAHYVVELVEWALEAIRVREAHLANKPAPDFSWLLSEQGKAKATASGPVAKPVASTVSASTKAKKATPRKASTRKQATVVPRGTTQKNAKRAKKEVAK